MKISRHASLIAVPLLLCIAAGLTACVSKTIKGSANVDPNAQLSSYRSYGFVPKPATNLGGKTTPLTIYFMQAVRHEMDSRGYRYTEDSPDLLVNFNANRGITNDSETSADPAYGYSGYYGYRAGLYGLAVLTPHDQVKTVDYKTGTANVDVVDAGKKMLVWEGIAEGRLTDDMMADPAPAVAKVVGEMFSQFPGKAAR